MVGKPRTDGMPMDAIAEFERRAALLDKRYERPSLSAVPGREGYGWIDFEGLPNTRDLGGLPAADGRRVRPGMLLRSGTLGFGTEPDLTRLRDEYRLRLVVDLRGTEELIELPDPMDAFPGARYVHADILAEKAAGITQDEDSQELARLRAQAGGADPVAFMVLLYPHLLLDASGMAGYRLLFESVLACEDGAALWHCYVGRDRCGMASVLMEAALGVGMADIEADYLATNVYAPRELTEEGATSLCSLRAAVDAASREFGSLEGYIREALGISDSAIRDLRMRCLERA